MKPSLVFIIFLLSGFSLFAQNISKEKIVSLVKLGKETNSSALILIKDNKVLVEEYYGKEVSPVYLSSASKVLVSIGIIKLLSEGRIKSLNQPVADFFPEWKQGQKRNITIQMLLNHTSGLQNVQNASLELEPPPNWKVKNVISLALAAEITSPPGTVLEYNNKAIALLGGIIEKASGKRMDAYFEEEFFKPMGIEKYDWIKDEAGNPTAHGAFILQAKDLAKFGELMINRGTYGGIRFFEERWVDSSFAVSQHLDERMALTWWGYSKENKRIIDEEQVAKLKTVCLSDTIYKKLEPLLNKSFETRDTYFAALESIFGKRWQQVGDSLFKGKSINFFSLPKVKAGKILGYYHTGFGGNYIVVIPQINLVAVRVVKRDEKYNYATDQFHGFVDEVFKLIETDK